MAHLTGIKFFWRTSRLGSLDEKIGSYLFGQIRNSRDPVTITHPCNYKKQVLAFVHESTGELVRRVGFQNLNSKN